jgi:List-Bact-rpt repeat protein
MRALVFVTIVGLTAAIGVGCRGLRIQNDRLLCGPHDACPSPYMCNVHGRCSLDRDASADATDGSDADGSNVDASDGSSRTDGPGADHNASDGPSADVADGPIADGLRADGPSADTNEVGHDGPAGGTFLLSVTTGGPSGAGMVLSTTVGVGINCGQTCSALVAAGTSVELVASPAATGSFSAWTGCTSVDTATCTVVISKATTVTATFKLKSGAACAQTGDCATGFCVSNVCCATACAGPCNGSCSTGTCLPQPARTACGTQTGQGGPGVGTDVSLICDGLGACKAPTISCPITGGDVSCDLNTKSCCHISFTLPNAETLTCTAPSSCATPDEGDNFDGYSCGHGSDCPLNKVCCERRYNQLYDWAICLDSCDPGTDILLP